MYIEVVSDVILEKESTVKTPLPAGITVPGVNEKPNIMLPPIETSKPEIQKHHRTTC